MKPLSIRQRAFAESYVGPAKGVGWRAAQQAGYAGNEAVLDTQARRLLGNAGVLLYIEELRAKTFSDAILTAEQCAVRLSGIAMGMVLEKRIVGGKDDFVEVDLPPPCSTQVKAIDSLADMRGYKSPTKTEVTGVVGLAQLTPEQDAALATWLRWRQDPVIAARIAELEGDG